MVEVVSTQDGYRMFVQAHDVDKVQSNKGWCMVYWHSTSEPLDLTHPEQLTRNQTRCAKIQLLAA